MYKNHPPEKTWCQPQKWILNSISLKILSEGPKSKWLFDINEKLTVPCLNTCGNERISSAIDAKTKGPGWTGLLALTDWVHKYWKPSGLQSSLTLRTTHTVQYSCHRNFQLRRWGRFAKFLSQTLLGPIGPNSSLRIPPTQHLWWRPSCRGCLAQGAESGSQS